MVDALRSVVYNVIGFTKRDICLTKFEMKRTHLISIFVFVLIQNLWCQIPNFQAFSNQESIDIGGFEYGIIPDFGNIQITQYRTNINLGTQLGKSLLGFGGQYNFREFVFSEPNTASSLNDFKTMHEIRFNLFYMRPLSESWNLMIMASPSLSSNFKGEISGNDFIFNSMANASKSWGENDKKSQLTFGVVFGTLLGRPQVFPLINYYKQFNSNSSITLGFPITSYQYTWNKKSTFSIYARPEGFFGNNTEEFWTGTQLIDETKIQLTSIRTGFNYRHKINSLFVATVDLGFIPTGSMEIIDGNNDTVYEFETDESFTINFGLRLNIERKKLKDEE